MCTISRCVVAALAVAAFSARSAVAQAATDTARTDSIRSRRHPRHPLALDTVTVRASLLQSKGYVAGESSAGTKTNTPRREVPQSISVITRQQMNDQQPQSLNEAVRYTPGITPEASGVSTNFWSGSSLLLRGFYAEVYQDGLQDDYNGNDLLDSYFYQRVDVLSGPTSVLYGEASPGGIVDVEMKHPPTAPLREIVLGFGSYGRYGGAFDVGGPIDTNGRFLYRLTGVGYSAGTQTDFVQERRVAIAPAFTWRPNAATTLTVLANYTDNPAIGQYAYVPAYGSVLPNPNGKIATSFYVGDPSFNKTAQQSAQAGYEFAHAFGAGWAVYQDLRYTDNRNHGNMIWPLALEEDMATLDRYSWVRNATFSSFLLDNRVQNAFAAGPVKSVLLAGVNYTHWYENWRYGADYDIPSIDLFAPVYHQDIPAPTSFDSERYTGNQIGAYAQDQISVGRWRVLLGARQDWVKETDAYGGSTQKQPDHKLTWRAGLVHLFDNGLAPYASYATSFQPDLDQTVGGTPLPPTTGRQYEAGIKYQRPGSSNALTAAVYDLAQQNVPTIDPQHPDFAIAIGEIRSRGIELQDQASLTRAIDLVGSYTYLDSRYTRTNETDTGIDGVETSLQHKYQYGVPSQTASLWLHYAVHSGGARGLGVGGGIRSVGFSYGDDVNSFRVPGFTLFDAAVQYDLGETTPSLRGYRLQLNASNVFDKSYVASCFSSDGCYQGLRRTVQATVTKTW